MRACPRDHPRIRGEHQGRADGSANRTGIIPAYAGNTSGDGCRTEVMGGSSPHTRGTLSSMLIPNWTTWDHPRIRGEHLRRLRDVVGLGGIIPAYAGNTPNERRVATATLGSSPHTRGTPVRGGRQPSSCWDHPRIRGEHRRRGIGRYQGGGIIPAYAGNTCTGEAQEPLVPGSSPHTRGTPACRTRSGRRTPDHPRIRGEHRPRGVPVHRRRGIIPAYAGNTVKSVTPSAAARGSSPHTRGTRRPRGRSVGRIVDHPRIRGEHVYGVGPFEKVGGIIPAYAGNTP